MTSNTRIGMYLLGLAYMGLAAIQWRSIQQQVIISKDLASLQQHSIMAEFGGGGGGDHIGHRPRRLHVQEEEDEDEDEGNRKIHYHHKKRKHHHKKHEEEEQEREEELEQERLEEEEEEGKDFALVKETASESTTTETETTTTTTETHKATSFAAVDTSKSVRNMFYHVFISPEDPQQAMKIVKEQLEQIGRTTYKFDETHLYFNTVGHTLHKKFMEQTCQRNRIQCHHLNHYKEGFEVLTHQDIKGFCSTPGNEQQNVVYLHSKGSYHPKPTNDHLRRSMTAAVSSPQCHTAFAQNQCNACGLLFAPEKFPFFPGNFWVAKCDYVNRLYDPARFEDAAMEVAKEALFMRSMSQLSMNIYKDMPETLGIGRYASEMWVGSHPSLEPCDVSHKHFKHWQHNDAIEAEFEVSKAPRTKTLKNKRVPKSIRDRKKEFFLLPGYILKWHHFYNAVPSANSWYWTFFPDGALWKSVSEQHGSEATHVVTKGFIKA